MQSKENLSALASRLNKLCNKLQEQFAINWGGCCYTAYCIAALLEQDHFEYSLIVFDEEFPVCNYDSLNDLPEVMDHYAIIIENPDEFIPVNCDTSDFKGYYTKFKVKAEDLLKYYLENRWNDFYKVDNNYLVKTFIEGVYYEFIEDLCKESSRS